MKKLLSQLAMLVTFKKPLVDNAAFEIATPKPKRWSIVGDALLRAESQVVHAAKILTNERLLEEDTATYETLVSLTKEPVAIKKRLEALRLIADSHGSKA